MAVGFPAPLMHFTFDDCLGLIYALRWPIGMVFECVGEFLGGQFRVARTGAIADWDETRLSPVGRPNLFGGLRWDGHRSGGAASSPFDLRLHDRRIPKPVQPARIPGHGTGDSGGAVRAENGSSDVGLCPSGTAATNDLDGSRFRRLTI